MSSRSCAAHPALVLIIEESHRQDASNNEALQERARQAIVLPVHQALSDGVAHLSVALHGHHVAHHWDVRDTICSVAKAPMHVPADHGRGTKQHFPP